MKGRLKGRLTVGLGIPRFMGRQLATTIARGHSQVGLGSGLGVRLGLGLGANEKTIGNDNRARPQPRGQETSS